MSETVSINAQGGGGEPHLDVNSTRPDAVATGNQAIALGYGNDASGTYSITIGYESEASNDQSIAIGKFAFTDDDKGIVIGGVSGAGTKSIALGYLCGDSGSFNVTLGYNSNAGGAGDKRNVSIGSNAFNIDAYGVAIGYGAFVTADGGVAIGHFTSVATGTRGNIAIGKFSRADASKSIAIGYDADSGSSGSLGNTRTIALGYKAETFGNRCVQIGNGTNSEDDTIKFLGATIANKYGVEAWTAFSPGGPPQISVPDGTLLVNTAEDTFSFYSGGTWQSPGGGGGITVQDDGLSIVIGATTTNFTGTGVVVTDVGGVATIDVPGGGGEDYFETNQTGTLPSVTGAESIAIGRECTSTMANSFSFGHNSDATGSPSVAIGLNVITGGDNAVGIGSGASANGDFSVSIGTGTSPGENGIAIGRASDAGTLDSISIGNNSDVGTNNRGIAIGRSAIVNGLNAIAIGYTAEAPGSDDADAIAIGTNCRAVAPRVVAIGKDIIHGGISRDSVFIGTGAGTGTASEQAEFSVAIGYKADAREESCIAIGRGATTSGVFPKSIAIGVDSACVGDTGGICIGYGAANSGALGVTNSVSIGTNSFTNGANAVAIGNGASAVGADCIAIGDGASSTLGAAQIGTGTNNTASTLQFLTNPIANSAGTQCTAAAAAPSGTPADGTFYLDTSSGNGTLHIYSNGGWRSVAVL